MAFLTENRREEGLMMNVPVADNIALASLARFGRTPLGIIDDARLAASAGEMAAALRIKSGPIGETPVKSLSGGNQQKVVIAKWLMAGPAIIILDEPTRGVDIAAKFEIYTMIDRLAADGCGILLISSEIEEAMAMCDRILVMSRGEIVGAFPTRRFDQEAIMRDRLPRRRGRRMTRASLWRTAAPLAAAGDLPRRASSSSDCRRRASSGRTRSPTSSSRRASPASSPWA